ncbi:PilW family protein [Neptunomonas phycophila]|uniref:PilW family protein n=1 Tax=Neptunomonas phycophila TaxID=1572645 RepID=A0AAW7XFG1_9GAMM|nr:PilW family protein [Neptunomonas phycophila]MDO6452961.1 PilW family protein [Neptunomonas phycophila]
MNKKCICKQSQAGFSLIELMVALVLGLVLMGAVVNSFLSSSQTYRVQEALSRSQESARFALEIIGQELRMAGFDNPRGAVLQGFAATEADANLPSPASVLDTRTSEVIYIVAHGDGGDLSIYVAPDGQSGLPTLYIDSQPSVEGVADIQFEYGINNGSDLDEVDQFQTAALVPDWEDVIAVRVNLLVSAGDAGLVDNAMTFAAGTPFNGFDTSDRRMYQVFSTTVALRNAMLNK